MAVRTMSTSGLYPCGQTEPTSSDQVVVASGTNVIMRAGTTSMTFTSATCQGTGSAQGRFVLPPSGNTFIMKGKLNGCLFVGATSISRPSSTTEVPHGGGTL